uniref:Uncharacterized protein n=1 Tax=Oryza brachyantha TaxID=4533 RepID=J3L1A3_ORYBR
MVSIRERREREIRTSLHDIYWIQQRITTVAEDTYTVGQNVSYLQQLPVGNPPLGLRRR